MRWIPRNVRLLDVGCYQGEFLKRVATRVQKGVGIDPLARPQAFGNTRLIKGRFPNEKIVGPFDAITFLAVLEHIPDPDRLVRACVSLLAPSGRLIITVPSPVVDSILSVLVRLRLIHGMSLEEHHGYRPADTLRTFEHAGLKCLCARRFQCGLNNLFVFERPRTPVSPAESSERPRSLFERRRDEGAVDAGGRRCAFAHGHVDQDEEALVESCLEGCNVSWTPTTTS